MARDRGSKVGRKAFLGASALAASAAALAGCRGQSDAPDVKLGRIVYSVLTPDRYDYAGMMRTIRTANPHKQLFPVSAAAVQAGTDVAIIYSHMQFALNGFQFSILGGGKLSTLGVLSGSAVVLALNDAMWQAYEIGKRFGLAKTNVYYRAGSDLDPKASPDDPAGLYQDHSAQAVLKRGGSFMVCHNALTYHAAACAARGGKKTADVLEEWSHNLLPGFSIVPSGITAIQLAAENGWKIYPVA